jgi:hypothetical protein
MATEGIGEGLALEAWQMEAWFFVIGNYTHSLIRLYQTAS